MKNAIIIILISIGAGAVGGYLATKKFLGPPRHDDVSSRLSSLEQAMKRREQADPLMPPECSVQPGLGEAQDEPCHTTFTRLILAPEQFHDRWIVVTGLYSNRIEETALYALKEDTSIRGIMGRHSAVWIHPYINSPDGRTKMTILGKFKNGPSGHFSSYFGTLSNASVTQERPEF